MTWGQALLADRATSILAAACQTFGGGVLLPALYCAEVADAIEAAGCPVRTYDVQADLSAAELPMTQGFRTVVWHHPFGRHLPPPRLDGVRLVEDACFNLRSVLAMAAPPRSELMVFSPRKEFSWPSGGVAIGDRAEEIRPSVGGASAEVSARWRELDPRAEVLRGTAANTYARSVLGDLLPAPTFGQEILTLLPLLSTNRDGAIDALRAEGVEAWCWQRPMPGCSAEKTPCAFWLWRRLVLLPVPPPRSFVYRLLSRHRFDPWPAAGRPAAQRL